MNLSSFILLSDSEKKWTVLHEGVLLAKRDDQDCKVFLFGLHNYYVETWCNQQSKVVQEYRVLHNSEFLQPYLQAIQLGDLLQ